MFDDFLSINEDSRAIIRSHFKSVFTGFWSINLTLEYNAIILVAFGSFDVEVAFGKFALGNRFESVKFRNLTPFSLVNPISEILNASCHFHERVDLLAQDELDKGLDLGVSHRTPEGARGEGLYEIANLDLLTRAASIKCGVTWGWPALDDGFQSEAMDAQVGPGVAVTVENFGEFDGPAFVSFLVGFFVRAWGEIVRDCLLYTSPSPRDRTRSRMPSSA